jgi:hypothetical protein
MKKIAKSRPVEHGLPFSTWSLAKLTDFLVAEGVVDDISIKGLRGIPRDFTTRVDGCWLSWRSDTFADTRDRRPPPGRSGPFTHRSTHPWLPSIAAPSKGWHRGSGLLPVRRSAGGYFDEFE